MAEITSIREINVNKENFDKEDSLSQIAKELKAALLKESNGKIDINVDDYIKYNFSSFTTEPSTSADGGDIRVIIDELFDINMFKEYIIDKYDFVDNGNKEYIANVKCGAKNYRDYLNDCYK